MPLFLLTMIGIVLGKLGLASHQFRSDLTELCFAVLFPASVVSAFSNMKLDTETMFNSAKLILLGAIWLLIPLVAAIWLTRLFHMEYHSANVLIFASIYNNFGFAGLGIVNSLFGGTGMFYANMLGLAYRLTNMPLGIWIMERGRAKQSGSSVGTVLRSPPVVALLIMIPVALLGIPLPRVIYETADLLNGCLSPIGMMMTGMAISDFSLSELIKGRACYIITVVRLVVLPTLMAVLMLAMGLEGDALKAPLVILGMPVAANCTLMAQKYDADKKIAAQCVLVSTILSLVTIPVLVTLANKFE